MQADEEEDDEERAGGARGSGVPDGDEEGGFVPPAFGATSLPPLHKCNLCGIEFSSPFALTEHVRSEEHQRRLAAADYTSSFMLPAHATAAAAAAGASTSHLLPPPPSIPQPTAEAAPPLSASSSSAFSYLTPPPDSSTWATSSSSARSGGATRNNAQTATGVHSSSVPGDCEYRRHHNPQSEPQHNTENEMGVAGVIEAAVEGGAGGGWRGYGRTYESQDANWYRCSTCRESFADDYARQAHFLSAQHRIRQAAKLLRGSDVFSANKGPVVVSVPHEDTVVTAGEVRCGVVWCGVAASHIAAL
jgi:hypothetical protein